MRHRLSLAVILLASLTLACGEPASNGTDVEAGAYIEGVAGSWQRINPIYASTNLVDEDLVRLVFSGLTRIGPDGRVEPDLAESWTISPDGREYRFTLREGLSWHDGEPVTSADVSFTVAQIVDPGFRGDPVLAELWLPVSVATPDVRTVVVTLSQPFTPFLARATTVGILPRHLLGTLSSSQLYNAHFNAAPVGTGPYRLHSVDSERAVLTAYERYHHGRASIDRIEVVFFADYPAASSRLGSRVEGLYLRDTAAERTTIVAALDRGFREEVLQGSSHVVLYLNNDRLPFDSANVRLAISLAIDREAIVADALGGFGVPSSSPIPPGTWTYKESADVTAQNREAALALLAAEGFVPSPGTGVLVREGVEFRFTIRTDNHPARVAVANAIAAQLDAIGIKASVASTSFAVLRRDFLQERLYDAAVAVWDPGPDPDPYFAWHSSQTGPEGLNLANYGNRVADALISQARVTSDESTRHDFYHQFQDVWQEQVPSVIIAYPLNLYLTSPSLQRDGPGVLFDGAHRFRDIERWQQ